jgi:hypothetical protein
MPGSRLGFSGETRRVAARRSGRDQPARRYGTPLHEAVIWGRTAIVERLLELGADPSIRSRDGRNARELAREQSTSGRKRTTIVTEERRREIERECTRIAPILESA